MCPRGHGQLARDREGNLRCFICGYYVWLQTSTSPVPVWPPQAETPTNITKRLYSELG